MQQGFGSILGRIVTVVAGLLLFGLVLRLIAAILSSVLPPSLMGSLTGGWDMLFGMLGSAVVPIMAAIILGAVVWIVVGKRH